MLVEEEIISFGKCNVEYWSLFSLSGKSDLWSP